MAGKVFNSLKKRAKKGQGYPAWTYKNKSVWKASVRQRWVKFRRAMNSNDSIHLGCAYYPEEVYRWIEQFEKMDNLMKDFYGRAK
jgi:hypothetical protein